MSEPSNRIDSHRIESRVQLRTYLDSLLEVGNDRIGVDVQDPLELIEVLGAEEHLGPRGLALRHGERVVDDGPVALPRGVLLLVAL